jgi:predicted membrane protein (TIGR00267 family)
MVKNRIKGRLEAALSMPETRPAIRRYFVNTIFDATVVFLGIIIGSALSGSPNLHLIVATILTTAVALGISTGFSIFEAESLEQNRRMDEIERALLRSLENTNIGKSTRSSILLISMVNFLAPITAGLIILAPFLFVGQEGIVTAAWVGVGLAFSILFVTGLFMGRTSHKNPWIQGVRMALVGVIVFVICFYIEKLV